MRFGVLGFSFQTFALISVKVVLAGGGSDTFLGESEIFNVLYKLHNLVDEHVCVKKPKKCDTAD